LARYDSLSVWSEGVFDGTVQRGSSLTLPRTFVDHPLNTRLHTPETARLGTYDVLLTLRRPATTLTIPEETVTIPPSEGVQVTETVEYPARDPMSFTVSGAVLGYTVWELDINIPGAEARTETVTRTVGAHDGETYTTRPESTAYKDEGWVEVAGMFAAPDASTEVIISLGDREIARGYDRIPFEYAGTAASCKNAVQEITTLGLIARTADGALLAEGFARDVLEPGEGYWTSPWLRVGAFDLPGSFAARMQADGAQGQFPNLFVRSRGAQPVTGWQNAGLRPDDTEFQFRVVVHRGQVVHSLTWSFESEYAEPTLDFARPDSTAQGFGLSYVPQLFASVGGQDVSDLLSKVDEGSLTLVVPRDRTVALQPGMAVTVTLDGQLVDSGYLTGGTRPSFVTGSVIELNFLRTGQLLGAKTVQFPGGLGLQSTEAAVVNNKLVTIGSVLDNGTPTLPFDDEGGFIMHVLANSPGSAQLLMDTRRSFRSLDFWMDENDQVTGTGGLNFKEMNEWTQHYGAQSKAGMEVIEQVCAANLLSVFALPDGNLLASDLVPAKDRTLGALVEETTMPDGTRVSSCYLRFHDQNGHFYPDYRFGIPERAHDVSDMASLVEVVGTSGPNQVNKDVPVTPVYMMNVESLSPAKEARISYSNWSFLNLGGSGSTQTFQFFDSNKNPIALAIGSEDVMHEVSSSRGQWDVKFTFHKGVIGYEDKDGDGNPIGDNDDVTGYTSVSVTYQLTDRTTDSHIDLVFSVSGRWLVGGDYETTELIGRPNQEFVPKWLPGMLEEAGRVRRVFGFDVRQDNNPYVVSLKGYPAGAPSSVQREWETLPDAVATALTLKEVLKTRETTLSYCGYAGWMPNQFVAVAKPPAGGIGAAITDWDVYLLLSGGTLSATVGGEITHSAKAAYLGTVHKDDQGQYLARTYDPLAGDWLN